MGAVVLNSAFTTGVARRITNHLPARSPKSPELANAGSTATTTRVPRAEDLNEGMAITELAAYRLRWREQKLRLTEAQCA